MSIPGDFFDSRGKFIPMKMVEIITGDELANRLVTPITSRGGDTMWHYKHELGIYKDDGIAYVKDEAKRALGKRSKTAYVNETVFHALIDTYIRPEEFVEDPNLVVVKNGVLNLDTMDLREHNHMDYAKAALPVTYDPDAKCPLFLKFLERVAPTYIEFLQEWTGYHLLKDQRHQRFVILLGDGDNGKSTYLHVLTCLLGKENVSGQSLYKITTNRFALAELYGKLANIAADIGPTELKYTGALKIATGEDRSSAERKFRDPFNFMNHAKLTFSCNQLPKTPDETLAWHKRHLVLLFDVIIPPEEQDKQLKDKLTTPEKLSGILNWALEGLDRLLKRHGFDEPTTIDERRTQYRRLSDPIASFAEDRIIEDPDEWETKSDVYRAFTQYCKTGGFVAPSDSVFFKEFKKHVYFHAGSRTINKRRTKVLNGIKLEGAAWGVHPARGVVPRDLGKYRNNKYKAPVQPTHLVQKPVSEKPETPPDQEDQLFVDAIGILQEAGGQMQQEDLFKDLRTLGYNSAQANLALRGDKRFIFMGMEVKLGKVNETG